MTTALVLTTDELRVSTTLGGAPIPATLHDGWAAEDIPVADTVALRGLLARGLATLDEGDIRLADDLSAALGPLLTGHVLVEVLRDGDSKPGRRLIAKSADSLVSAAEREPDLWHVGPFHTDLIGQVLAELVEHLSDVELSYPSVTLPTDLLVEAERRSTTGATEQLPGMLAQRGLPPGASEIVARVLGDLNATVTVMSSHRNRSTTHCAAITWLETGSSGVWLAVPDDDLRADNDMADPPTGLAGHIELRPVGRDTLRNEVRDVLGMLGTERTE